MMNTQHSQTYAHSIRQDVERLAVRAGKLALTKFRRDKLSEEKEFGELVTEVDREVEIFLRNQLQTNFGPASILGEEYGGELDEGRVWILDPIDGTNNYARGIAHWCVSIALFENMQPILGVIFSPCDDELFSAVAGGGVTLNGTPIFASTTHYLSSAIVGFGLTRRTDPDWSSDRIQALAEAGVHLRAQGAGALTIAHVAAGRLDGFFEKFIRIWDIAAAMLILKESGGVIRHNFDASNPSDGFPVICGCHGIVPSLQAYLELKELEDR